MWNGSSHFFFFLNVDKGFGMQWNPSSDKSLIPYFDIHSSEMDYQKIRKCRVRTWIETMEAAIKPDRIYIYIYIAWKRNKKDTQT